MERPARKQKENAHVENPLSYDDTDDGKEWTGKISSSSLSQEELSALKGCVTKRRTLFSPRSSSFASFMTFPELPYCHSKLGGLSKAHDYCDKDTQHIHHGSLEYDHLEEFDRNLLSSSVTNSVVPNSVSVQFGYAGYECEAICESNSKQPRQKHIGLNITAMSKSDCNIDLQKFDQKCKDSDCQCLPLSSSIPGELNSSGLRSQRSIGLAGLKVHSLEQGLCHHQNENSAQSNNKTLCNSWPRQYLFQKKQLKTCTHNNSCKKIGTCSRCSPKHTPQLSPLTSPIQSPQILRTKRPMSHQGSCIPQCSTIIRKDLQSNSCLPSPFELGSTVSISSYHSVSNPSLTNGCRPHISYNAGVDGQIFKDKSEMFLRWFEEFNDQQRNVMLLKLLERCNCAQMHFLSLQMEPVLHDGCPHNCEDLLSWLPFDIATHVLSYLDPVSLCHASQVCRSWYNLTSQQDLWKDLCKLNAWQFSLKGEIEQLENFTSLEGTVQWKEMFAERFRIRRNWRKGYCNVRTFEGHTQGISCIQFDNTRIVSGSWDKTIKVWNRRTNTAWAALTLAGHSGTVRCLHLHGNRLVSGSSDRTIKVWDLATDKIGWVGAACRATMVGHMHTVRCLQADDNKVISGSYDLTLKVWDIKTGHCQQTLRGHTDAVLCLQFDDHKLVSGSKDTTIKIWSLDGGSCKLTLHGHQAAVSCLQFDDTRIISGALDRLIKIWNIANGECVRTIDWIRSEGHTGVVRYLQADRWKIVSAADDKTLKIWSAYTGDRLLTLKSHTDGVTCLQFDDKVIVSGSYDKTVKLWDFSAC